MHCTCATQRYWQCAHFLHSFSSLLPREDHSGHDDNYSVDYSDHDDNLLNSKGANFHNISISILNKKCSSLNTFKRSSRLLHFASSAVFAQLFNISKSIFNARFGLSWILLIFAQDCFAVHYILPFLCFTFSIW